MENYPTSISNIPKWGFGMAPISSRMRLRYDAAVQAVADLLQENIPYCEVNLDHLSELKGMFNRCIRQDQWEWFTVFTELGEPSARNMRSIVSDLVLLRRSIVASDYESSALACKRLLGNNLFHYLNNYQITLNVNESNLDAGWIYILSTRQQKDVLKIGMTRRSVAERVAEINGATGVLIPLSARRVFRVKHARKTERDIHLLLGRYRIRQDREFFNLPFDQAVKLIENHLVESKSHLRKRGEIIWFDVEANFGFISAGETSDVFVHVSEVDAGQETQLEPGIQVEFDLIQNPRGPVAQQVEILRDDR